MLKRHVEVRGVERRARDAGPPGDRVVRLLEAPRRQPATVVERLAVSVLAPAGVAPLAGLAERVARDLYVDALKHGAWVMDIGALGEEVFAADVARALEAADGILWRIDAAGSPG